MDAIEFKTRLKRSGMTRFEAAESLGVSLDSVHGYCKGKTSLPIRLADVVKDWPQHVAEPSPMGNGVELLPIEKAVPVVDMGNDWETGYQPITEAYAKSLGYFAVYRESDWFERARAAIIRSRQLGETRGKIAGHPRWGGSVKVESPAQELVGGIQVTDVEFEGSVLKVSVVEGGESRVESFKGSGKNARENLVVQFEDWCRESGVAADCRRLILDAGRKVGE